MVRTDSGSLTWTATHLPSDVDAADLPLTGTCDLSTRGPRSGQWRRVEICFVIIDAEIVVTGTPGRT